MPEPGLTSIRDAVRWGLLLASVAVAGFRLPRAYRDYQKWNEFRLIDPSGADFYWMDLKVNIIGVAIILLIGVGVFFLLRRRKAKIELS